MKRATIVGAGDVDYGAISIHALVKRATGLADSSNGSKGDFNPRPREEGDSVRQVKTIVYRCISIHALVKRATAVSDGQKGF